MSTFKLLLKLVFEFLFIIIEFEWKGIQFQTIYINCLFLQWILEVRHKFILNFLHVF